MSTFIIVLSCLGLVILIVVIYALMKASEVVKEYNANPDKYAYTREETLKSKDMEIKRAITYFKDLPDNTLYIPKIPELICKNCGRIDEYKIRKTSSQSLLTVIWNIFSTIFGLIFGLSRNRHEYPYCTNCGACLYFSSG